MYFITKAADIRPYSETYFIKKARTKLFKSIKALQAFKKFVNEHYTQQFDTDYDAFSSLSIPILHELPATSQHLADLLKFKLGSHKLNSYDMFANYTDFHLDSNGVNYTQLTQATIREYFGSEGDASSEHDDSPDYDPGQELDEDELPEIDADEQKAEAAILRDYETRNASKATSFYDPTDDILYLNECNASCADLEECIEWLQCDGCEGWRCSEHIFDETGYDLSEHEETELQNMGFLCLLCIQNLVNVIDIKINYCTSMMTQYFGKNGVRSKTILAESVDDRWKGLSIDLILDTARSEGYNLENIRQNMLNNDDYLKSGLDQFLDLYGDYRYNSRNSKYEPYFNAPNYDVIQAFILLKKHMISYIMQNISKYSDTETIEIVTFDKFMLFKHDIYIFFNEEINTNIKYNIIKVPWSLSVAELRQESIAEHLLSRLGKIYTKDRHSFTADTIKEMLTFRTSLPNKSHQRLKVCNMVKEEYKSRFPHLILHNTSSRNKSRRSKKGQQSNVSNTMMRKTDVYNICTLPFDD